MPETVRQALDRFLAAYETLAELGEGVEDEWSYVNDLTNAWRSRLDAIANRRGHDPIAPELTAALDALVAELQLIRDPHRAIDWLSTAPQVALAAFGEEP